jgi:hypothetical protein
MMHVSLQQSICQSVTLSFCHGGKMLPSVNFFHPILNINCQHSALTRKSQRVRSLFWKIFQAFKHCEVIYIWHTKSQQKSNSSWGTESVQSSNRENSLLLSLTMVLLLGRAKLIFYYLTPRNYYLKYMNRILFQDSLYIRRGTTSW